MTLRECTLRVAQPTDKEAVTAVLTSGYLALAADYDPAVLAVALPLMTAANPGLLACGTYYVQQTPDGRIVSCGGWSQEEPGTRNVQAGIAHIRHFATHADWIRRGLAASIFERCRREGLAGGIRTFKCFSSLGAVPFYASLGFAIAERADLVIGDRIRFPAVTMVWTS